MDDVTLTNGITVPAAVLSLAGRCTRLQKMLAALRDVRRLPCDLRVTLQATLDGFAWDRTGVALREWVSVVTAPVAAAYEREERGARTLPYDMRLISSCAYEDVVKHRIAREYLVLQASHANQTGDDDGEINLTPAPNPAVAHEVVDLRHPRVLKALRRHDRQVGRKLAQDLGRLLGGPRTGPAPPRANHRSGSGPNGAVGCGGHDHGQGADHVRIPILALATALGCHHVELRLALLRVDRFSFLGRGAYVQRVWALLQLGSWAACHGCLTDDELIAALQERWASSGQEGVALCPSCVRDEVRRWWLAWPPFEASPPPAARSRRSKSTAPARLTRREFGSPDATSVARRLHALLDLAEVGAGRRCPSSPSAWVPPDAGVSSGTSAGRAVAIA